MAKKYMYTPGTNPFADRGNTGYCVTNVDLGFAKEAFTGEDGEQYDGEKFEIYWPLPRVEDHDSIDSLSEECQSFWGDKATLQAIIAAGVAQLQTRPNYKVAAKDKVDKVDKQAAAQSYATDYVVGRQAATGPGQKKKAQAYDALEQKMADMGVSMDDLLSKVQNGEIEV